MVSHWMGRNRSYEEDSAWARRLLNDLGVGKRAHHYPFEMSGGEVQRVAVARALFNRPRLIIADEPVGNLDRNSRGAVLELLREVTRKYDTCVIMATHDEDSIHYVDEAYRIEPGGLISISASPDHLLAGKIPVLYFSLGRLLVPFLLTLTNLPLLLLLSRSLLRTILRLYRPTLPYKVAIANLGRDTARASATEGSMAMSIAVVIAISITVRSFSRTLENWVKQEVQADIHVTSSWPLVGPLTTPLDIRFRDDPQGWRG